MSIVPWGFLCIPPPSAMGALLQATGESDTHDYRDSNLLVPGTTESKKV